MVLLVKHSGGEEWGSGCTVREKEFFSDEKTASRPEGLGAVFVVEKQSIAEWLCME